MQRRSLYFAAAAASMTIFSVAVAGHAALTGAADARVDFQCTGPAGFKIDGKGSELTVAEDSGNVVITVPIASLKTGIDLRDHHMKEKYLEAGKYPTATLTIARAGLKFPAPGGRVEGDAPASFKLHGQARPVTVHYDAKADGASFETHGKFHINMNDYGIVVPSYLGITVKPDVDVSANFRASGN